MSAEGRRGRDMGSGKVSFSTCRRNISGIENYSKFNATMKKSRVGRERENEGKMEKRPGSHERKEEHWRKKRGTWTIEWTNNVVNNHVSKLH
jgi:hypothetical protein